MEKQDYLERIQLAAEAISEAGRKDMTATVPSCPDWDVACLIGHQGFVFRFAGATVEKGSPDEPANREDLPRPPDDGPPEGENSQALLDWFADSTQYLLGVFEKADMSKPVWNWSVENGDAKFWFRRQVHETAIHAFDAAEAVGQNFKIPKEWGIDGVDEYLTALLPGNVKNMSDPPRPTGTLHIHCTDEGGEWFCELKKEDEIEVTREHKKADAALKGSGENLMLAVWNRININQLTLHGDAEIAKQWLGFAP